MGKYLYIRVSRDRYELPEAVADSPTQLARMVGVKPTSVRRALVKGNNGVKTTYKKVRIDDE